MRIISLIFLWPLWALLGFLFICGYGFLGDGHYQPDNSESYPGQYQDQQEAIQWEKGTGREEKTKLKSDQYQLENNPDHQIH